MAAKMLEGVFQEAEVQPNDVPMEVLAHSHTEQQEPFLLQRSVLVLIMVLFLLLPLLFIAPTYTLETAGPDSEGLPEYNLKVDTSLIPVREVLATMNGKSVNVEKTGKKRYRISPDDNGQLELEVVLFNYQRTRQRIEVTEIDEEKPVLLKSLTDNKRVYLYVKDKDSGVDFKKIYGVNEAGKEIKPESFDSKTGEVVFRYPSKRIEVYVPDHLGNVLHLSMDIT